MRHEIDSDFLHRKVAYDLVGVPGVGISHHGGMLLLNDGQLADSLNLEAMLDDHAASGRSPVLAVAIHAGVRKEEYGVTGMHDYMGRGARAFQYEQFVIQELLPYISESENLKIPAAMTAFAGFSLGGLSAMDIVSSNTGSFAAAGIFSGSLWWRSKSYEEGYTDNDRILFNKLQQLSLPKEFKCYLMAGTDDERCDRNADGVIDAVADTLDMYELLTCQQKLPHENIFLNIVNGGQHNPATWSLHLPEFMRHVFSNKNHKIAI